MFNVSEWNIYYCEDLGALSRGTMNVVLHNTIVENGITLCEQVFILAILYLDLTLHHVDELLTLVG